MGHEYPEWALNKDVKAIKLHVVVLRCTLLLFKANALPTTPKSRLEKRDRCSFLPNPDLRLPVDQRRLFRSMHTS